MRLIIDVQVKDLDRATKFYANVLELPCRKATDTWSAITVGDAELHLYTNGGITGDIEFYVTDIDSKVAKLMAKGISIINGLHKPQAINVDASGITTFPWGRTAFFLDSEGNELALVEDSE